MKALGSLKTTLTRSLTDRTVRSRARLHETPLDEVTISVAHTAKDYEEAFRLLRACYIYQGLEDPMAGLRRLTPHHMFPSTTTLLARRKGTLVGTMSITMDSLAGLPIDRCSQAALEAPRQAGARLMEFGSLAITHRFKGSGTSTLLTMAAYHIGIFHLGATHGVVQCHPKGEKVYRAMWGFNRLADPVKHPDLGEAAATTLLVDFQESLAHIRRRHPAPLRDGRAAITHFEQPAPSIDIPEQLADLDLYQRWKLPPDVVYGIMMPDLFDRLTRPQIAFLVESWPHPGRLRLPTRRVLDYPAIRAAH